MQPRHDAFGEPHLQVRHPRYQGSEEDGWFLIDPARAQSGACAYDIGFRGLGAEVEGKHVQYDVNMAGEEVVIYCRNRDIPAGYAPSRCGA